MVAAQGQQAPSPNGVSLDGHNGGQPGAVDVNEDLLQGPPVLSESIWIRAVQFLQVDSGGENSGGGGCEDEAVDLGGVGFDFSEGEGDGLAHFEGEGVYGRPIQEHRCTGVFEVIFHLHERFGAGGMFSLLQRCYTRFFLVGIPITNNVGGEERISKDRYG